MKTPDQPDLAESIPDSRPLSESRAWALNVGARFTYKLVASLGNIVLAAYLVKLLGSDIYGTFRSASGAIAFLSLAEGGLTMGAYGLVIRYLTHRDYDNASAVVIGSFRIMAKIALSLALTSWPLALALSYFYNVSETNRHDFVLTATISSFGLIFGFLSGPFVWVLQARRRDYISTVAQLPLAIISPFVVYLFARQGGTAYLTALGFLIMIFLGNMTCTLISLKLHPWIRWKGLTHDFKEIGHRTKYTFTSQIAGVVAGQTLTWVISFHLGMGAVSTLLLSMTFFAFSRDFLQIMSQSLLPAMGARFHQKDYMTTARLWQEMVLLMLGLAVTGGAGIFVCNERLVACWVGLEHFAGNTATLLMAISFVIFGMNTVSSNILYAIDEIKSGTLIVVWETVFAVILSFVGAHFWGMKGALAGALVSQSISLIASPWFICKRLGTTAWSIILGSIRILAVGIVFTLALKWSIQKISHGQWTLEVPLAIACCLLIGLGIFLLGFSQPIRLIFINRFRHIVFRSNS